jgi:hypothetical protein
VVRRDIELIPRCEPRPGRLKRCTKCLQWWTIECFTRDPSSPDFHERRCKACRAERRNHLRALARASSRSEDA